MLIIYYRLYSPADHFLDVINTFPKDLPCGRLEALVEAYQKSGMKEDNESLCSMSFSDSFEAYDEVMPKVQAVKRPLWPSKLWALLRRNFLE